MARDSAGGAGERLELIDFMGPNFFSECVIENPGRHSATNTPLKTGMLAGHGENVATFLDSAYGGKGPRG
jgi:hypothetical protein